MLLNPDLHFQGNAPGSSKFTSTVTTALFAREKKHSLFEEMEGLLSLTHNQIYY